MSQTIEQRRAEEAWKAVGEQPKKEYVTLLQGAPVAIQTTGFGQTIAFYVSRIDRPEYRRLLEQLTTWILRDDDGNENDRPNDKKQISDLIEALQSCDMQTYRRRTSEVLAYLGWLKRFASARLLLNADTEKTDE